MITEKKKGIVVNKPLTSVMEDYLEAIVELDQDKKVVRVKDIAKRMDSLTGSADQPVGFTRLTTTEGESFNNSPAVEVRA